MRILPYLFMLLCLGSVSCSAQSPVGSWKRISMIVVDSNGTKTDEHQSLSKEMPCSVNITYDFLSDGKIRTNASGCPEFMQKAAKKTDMTSRWKVSGDKIIVSSTDNSLPPFVSVVSYKGNTMSHAFHFSENPKVPNPFRAKSTTVVYQRIK